MVTEVPIAKGLLETVSLSEQKDFPSSNHQETVLYQLEIFYSTYPTAIT